jgi:hypothetical protein
MVGTRREVNRKGLRWVDENSAIAIVVFRCGPIKIFDGAVLFTCTAMSLPNVSGFAEGGVSRIFFLSIGPAQAASP